MFAGGVYVEPKNKCNSSTVNWVLPGIEYVENNLSTIFKSRALTGRASNFNRIYETWLFLSSFVIVSFIKILWPLILAVKMWASHH